MKQKQKVIFIFNRYSKSHDRLNIPENHQVSEFVYKYEAEDFLLKNIKNSEMIAVSLDDYKQVITENKDRGIFWNTCDGIESDGYLGISAALFLEENHLDFIGGSSEFVAITTSKHEMKQRFIKNNVNTARYAYLTGDPAADYLKIQSLFQNNNEKFIIKIDNLYASVGLDYDSVVGDIDSALKYLKKNHLKDVKFIMEQFICGREFKVLCVGDKKNIKVYNPIEKIFSEENPYHQFITYEANLASFEDSFKLVPDNVLNDKIKEIAADAYLACEGTSYGRVDIRYDGKDLYVLEVNSLPGIGLESSVDSILTMNNRSHDDFFNDIMESMC